MHPKFDPRHYQIAVLGSLFCYGSWVLDFEVSPAAAAFSVGGALLCQAAIDCLRRRPIDPRSALITALSIALLLRANQPAWIGLAAGLAVASKALICWRGKHVFNPSLFGIVSLLATTDAVWVSAGQWGSGALLALAASSLGLMVITRAKRADITWAFLIAAVGLGLARTAWLGDPFDIPLHALSSGSFLIFAFFMISDPKTAPDSRPGRLIFAAAVAATALALQYGPYWNNPLLWALTFCAPAVPLVDCLFPAGRYHWPRPTTPFPKPLLQEISMKTTAIGAVAALALLLLSNTAQAFCGFYVAKADAQLFNKASQVVLVRDGNRTIVTMSNDFQGDPKEFAMVIPVPTFLERNQINVGERAVIDHLDAYTAPRLVEYHDPDPCARWEHALESAPMSDASGMQRTMARKRSKSGVTIEATYTVGEYDIQILSAKQSNGLADFLVENGYRLPDGAEPVLKSYLKQGMRFFVAKVNLEAQQKLGFAYLRPLQIAYESPKFMLPIRLGTLNADGTQDLFVYTLTRKGRVETTNYRTAKLPTGDELPVYVKDEFPDFYRALFDEQVRRENMRAVFLEYAWDMNWCDPCAADPLSDRQLKGLGVFWLGDSPRRRGGKVAARDVFVTRLHVRYDAEHFPSDLVFQETGDRQNFQGRYVIRHAFSGQSSCDQAVTYREQLRERQEREAQTLASLTGWKLSAIREKLRLPEVGPQPWWHSLWQD